ncbi:SMP-30/gluconolactonase/LRE family protein [Bacillus pseudomycoides]|uniref:SMP-30/gluconolactonase/LRE family protein n=1 Tax=Bacillus pseudomycoides TaxID=64104 RepID=UPI000BEBEF12|nr:SMP-30/gluconolactonase/LRE family protein [Bacillus pseudomycoides]PDZ71606.1 Senescence marker protein-30 [Bacillus pseudomycoides]
MLGKLELVIDAKANFGEGPCWDEEKQILYWVDILGKKVCIYNPITNINRKISLDQQIGCVVQDASGGVILAMERGFHSLNLETEELKLIHNPESHLPENRFNDGKCDPAGRFWAGTTDLYGVSAAGSLYFLDTDFSVKKQLEHVNTSNGLAWSPDQRYLYFIDTPTKKVTRFDYDIHTGTISNPIDIIIIPNSEGLPDGMTIDEEGCLWISHWGGAKITRWNPMTGEKILTVPVPALNVTSCTFGGPDLTELYITTARTRMNQDQLEVYPYAGGVFRIKTQVKGCPTYQFNHKKSQVKK